MDAVRLQRPAVDPGEIDYPSSDGEPMAETGVHVLLMLALIAALRHHYRQRPDVYVIGNIFLYYEEGNNAARRSPDVMVIKGVPALPERDSFKTWEEKAVPCVVLELTSNKTADEDQGPKKELYERLGVREYFLFDPLGDYLPRPLVGYRLVRTAEESAGDNGGGVQAKYEELPNDQEGGLFSSELGLRLMPEGTDLALVDFRTQERVPAPLDLYRQVEEVTRRAQEAERQRAEAGRLRAEAERRSLEAERQRQEEQRQREEAERQRSEAERLRQEAERRQQETERQRQEAVRRAEQAEGQAKGAQALLEEQQRQAEELRRELERLRALLPPDRGDNSGTA
jgi:Uma2 family endonuclease